MTAKCNRPMFLAAALSTLGFLTCGKGNTQTTAVPNGIGFWDVIEDHNAMLLGVGIGPKRNNVTFHNQTAVPNALVEQLVGMQAGDNPTRRVRFHLVREAGTFDGTGSVQGRAAGGTIVSFALNEQYAADVLALGMSLSQRDLLELAVFDIGRATLAAALKQNPHVTVEEVVQAVSCERVFKDCGTIIRPSK